MHTNFFLRLLVILLALSYVLSSSAVPATRTQDLKVEDTSAMPSSAKLEDAGNGEEVMVDMHEGFIEIMRRMDLGIQDYEGAGANRDHDPKSPGGA